MADHFCNFLDFRSLTTNHKFPLILPSNRCYSSPHTHSSRISRIKRRPPHLSLFSQSSSHTPSSSEIDVISTHEHPDGSLLFRFGDPSEVKKNVEPEESKTVKEKIERESKDVSAVLKAVEGDSETEVTAKKADTEVIVSSSTEVADYPNAVVSSSKTAAVVEGEGESESCEKLMEGSSDTQLPVLTSNGEIECISTPDVVDVDHIENMEEGLNEDYEYSSPVESVLDEGSKVESDIGTVALSEKETAAVTPTDKEMGTASAVDVEQTRNVEEGLNEKYADSPVDRLDRSAEILNNITTVALSEKETCDSTALNIEQIGNEEHEESSTVNASYKSPEVENNTTILDFSDNETSEVSSATEEHIIVPDYGVLQDNLETDFTTDVSMISEHQNVETEMQNEATEDERESFGSNLVSQIEEENMQAAKKDTVSIGKSSESEMNDIIGPNIQNAIDNGNASDISDAEAKSPPVEAAVNLPVGSEDKASEEIQLVTRLPRLEADSALVEDTGVGTVEESQADNGNAGNISDAEAKSPPMEASVNLSVGSEDKASGDMIQLVTDPPTLEADAALEENTGTGTVEESHEDNGNASDTSNAEAKSSSVEAAVNLPLGSEDNASGDMIQLLTEPPTLEADSVLKEDTSIGIVEQSSDGSENLIMDRDLVEASVREAAVLNETAGCASEEDMIETLTVPPQLEDDSVLEEETGIATVKESHEDDGSENLKVVGALVEASEPETTTLTESSTMSHEMSMTNFVLSSGADLLPHPSKVLTGGEDAYFIAGQTWLGVADGVGLWSLEGTNPGVYAQELMKNCGRLISTENGNSIYNPIELLSCSVAETQSPGSSTVLVAQFDGQALHVANIGDAGFIVVRDGVVYKRSSPMHHIFHFPIQIERGVDPSSLAEFYTVDLEEEDIIITATDGLLDNLYDQEISSIVTNSLAADKKLEEIAELLAMKAQEIGKSAYVRTPFGDNARAAGFAGYSGGKLDDVAVIVSMVQKR